MSEILKGSLNTLEREKYLKDIDGCTVVGIVPGRSLTNLFGMVNSAGFLDGEDYDGFLVEENPVTKFKTFHFFNQGNEVFSIVLGFNSNNDIGALKTEPGNIISSFHFVQGLNLGDEPAGSTIGAMFVIGGNNVDFTILQDASGYFEVSDGNLIKSIVSVPEGQYTLIIRAQGNNSQYIDQIVINVLATALISNINLSGSIVQDTAPNGTSIGALTTQGGKSPIAYSIAAQLLDGNPVDVFEIVNDTLVTKAPIADVDDVYSVFIRAEDSRVELPDDERIKVEEFPILVVEDTFVNTRSLIFNGIDEFLNIPYSISLYGNTKLSCSAWLKLNNSSGERSIVSQFGQSGKRGFRFYTSGQNLILNISENGSNTTSYATAGNLITLNNWHHVAFAFDGDGNEIRLYLNGVEVLNSATPYNSYNNPLEPTRIGARGDSSFPEVAFFSGNLEEVSLYNTALTLAQFVEIYNLGAPRNITSISSGGSLLGWWRMGDFFNGVTDPDQIGSNDADGVNMGNGNRSSDVPV